MKVKCQILKSIFDVRQYLTVDMSIVTCNFAIDSLDLIFDTFKFKIDNEEMPTSQIATFVFKIHIQNLNSEIGNFRQFQIFAYVSF